MKFPKQVEEIRGVCARLGIGYEQLAELAVINRESMRKYAKGYQPMPDVALNAIKLVEQIRIMQSGHSREWRQAPDDLAVSYRMMETPTLMSSLSDLATKLRKMSNQDRKHVLGSLRAMLIELENRELTGVLKLDEGEEQALSAAPSALRIVRESSQKQKVAAPTGGKHAPGGAAGGGSR